MISWFARNDVAANLLLVAIVVMGLYSLNSRIPLEVFPDFELDMINVNVSLRGATPEDVEQGITTRIEEAVLDLEGVEKVTSRSAEAISTVNIEVDGDYDPRELLADVKSRVDAINTLPVAAEKPVVSLAQHRRGVISVSVHGHFSEGEIREYADQVRDDLVRLPGVTQVDLVGVRNYEIAVEAPQDRLREYGLTLAQISRAIGNSSLDLSAGNIRAEGGDVLIRSKGQAYRRDEFEQIVVKSNNDGSILRLGDIARVTDGFEETFLRTRFNGEPAALIEVYRVGDESAIEVAEQVHAYIESKRPYLPQGLSLSHWDDDSTIVKNRLRTLTTNAMQGGILVLLLLTLFLRPAVAFWVFIGVPVSFMGAFLVMGLLGVSLNIISLFGFILVLGIVVDDAIVTGENIYRHLSRAENGLQAAIRGTHEIAVPVTFGVLTTVVAFMALGFIEGARGAIFAQIPAVVVPVLLFSLIESKLVLPAHLKHVRLQRAVENVSHLERWQQNFASGFERAVILYYRPILKTCLRNRYSVLASFAGFFILLITLLNSGWMHFTFFPRVPSETARLNLTMPVGTPFEVTARHIERIEQEVVALREKYRDPETGESIILNILSTSGSMREGAHAGRVLFEIMPPEQSRFGVGIKELVQEWRQRIGVVPGAESMTFRAEIGRAGDPIDVQLSSVVFTDLEKVAKKVQERLAVYPGVFDILDNIADGKEELQIELTRQGHALGLSRNDIISQVRQAFFGVEAQRVQRGRDDVRVMVRLPLAERRSLADLQDVLIAVPGGGRAPFSELARVVPGQSLSAIYRTDAYRTVNVRADIEKDKVNMTALKRDMEKFLDEVLMQYPGISYQFEGEAREQSESFVSLWIGLLLVLFAIYSLLAIPFKSYSQPLVVMSVIPFGAIGAVIGHWIMGDNLTIMSVMGILALIGVVVNDSLVLVDYINQRRRLMGMGLLKSILKAGTARFRPVMLTSLTTFIGLMPLLFEKSTQAQFLIPMAVSLGFGIIFATLLTLLLVPINYLILEDLKSRFGWNEFRRRKALSPET